MDWSVKLFGNACIVEVKGMAISVSRDTLFSILESDFPDNVAKNYLWGNSEEYRGLDGLSATSIAEEVVDAARKLKNAEHDDMA